MTHHTADHATGTEPIITSITAIPSDPNLRSIRVNGRVVATLRASEVDRLELVVHRPWTDDLAQAAHESVEKDRGRKAALQILARSDRSTSELRDRLVQRGVEQATAERVVAELAADGWIDDARLASELAERLTRRQAASPALVRTRLKERGFDPQTIETAIEAGLGSDAAAEEWVKKRRRELHRLPEPVQARRIMAGLQRRGFDEETIGTLLREAGLDVESSD